MDNDPAETLLQRLDPCRNMVRFYVLSIQPTLFGGSSMVREWRRIGTRGQVKIALCDDVSAADFLKSKLERDKRWRGYIDRMWRGTTTAVLSGLRTPTEKVSQRVRHRHSQAKK